MTVIPQLCTAESMTFITWKLHLHKHDLEEKAAVWWTALPEHLVVKNYEGSIKTNQNTALAL